MRGEALAAEGDVGGAREATEFAGGIGEVDDRVGGSDGTAGGALVPGESAGAGFDRDFGAPFGVARDKQETYVGACFAVFAYEADQ